MSQDSQLQQAMPAEFAWEPSLTASAIGVMPCEGTVTLTSDFESFARERAVMRVKAVVPWQIGALAGRIELRLPSSIKCGDDQIAVAAINCWSWDVSVPCGNVEVDVENGWVALNGQADPDHRREAVRENIRTPVGIRGVSDGITVSTRVNAADPDHEINHALHRSWFLSPNEVRVSAKGGTVCLAVAIRSPRDREVVAATASAAPGATAVLNGIAAV